MRRVWVLFALFNVAFASRAREIVKSWSHAQILQHTSIFEAVDTIVEHVGNEFPEILPANEAEKIAIKRELIFFLLSPITLQDLAISGAPSNFTLISDKITQLRKIAKRELPKTGEMIHKELERKEGVLANENDFVFFHCLVDPLTKLLERNIANYEEQGLTRQQIEQDINLKQVVMYNLWLTRKDKEDLHRIQIDNLDRTVLTEKEMNKFVETERDEFDELPNHFEL